MALTIEGHSWKHCTKRNGKKKKKKSEWIAFHSCKDTQPHIPLLPLKSGLKGTALEVHSRRAWLSPHISSAVSARAPVSSRRQVRSLEGKAVSHMAVGRCVCVGGGGRCPGKEG